MRSVRFPAAPVGSVLSVDQEVRERPYFPAGFVELGSSSGPVESLRVEVKGGGAGWRWRLDEGRAIPLHWTGFAMLQ